MKFSFQPLFRGINQLFCCFGCSCCCTSQEVHSDNVNKENCSCCKSIDTTTSSSSSIKSNVNNMGTVPSKTNTTTNQVSDDTKENDEFVFKQNSYKMYVDVCNLSPKPFRHFTRDSLKGGMRKYAIYDEETDPNHTGKRNVITEDIMYVVVKEVTPHKYLKQALEILDKDRTP